MRKQQPNYFDPATDDAYNTTRIEIRRVYDRLVECGHDEYSAMLRNPADVDLAADLGLDPSPGDPKQVRIARAVAREAFDSDTLTDLRDKSGRLRW